MDDIIGTIGSVPLRIGHRMTPARAIECLFGTNEVAEVKDLLDGLDNAGHDQLVRVGALVSLARRINDEPYDYEETRGFASGLACALLCMAIESLGQGRGYFSFEEFIATKERKARASGFADTRASVYTAYAGRELRSDDLRDFAKELHQAYRSAFGSKMAFHSAIRSLPDSKKIQIGEMVAASTKPDATPELDVAVETFADHVYSTYRSGFLHSGASAAPPAILAVIARRWPWSRIDTGPFTWIGSPEAFLIGCVQDLARAYCEQSQGG